MRRLVNRVSVEASFFKKMSAGENLHYAARYYGMGPRETRVKIPAILDEGRLPDRPPHRADGEPLARDAAEGRARAGAARPRRCCCCSTSRRRASTRARSSRCRTSSARCGSTHDSTILLCTHDLAEAEALADRVGILDRGELLFLETVPEILERFGVETLEQAFFAATGREFEAEVDEDDEDREVFA